MSELDPARIEKHSVVLRGHRTSISLERAFWDALKRSAAARNLTVNQLVTDIDDRRRGNLSSAIRVHLLQEAEANGSAADSLGCF